MIPATVMRTAILYIWCIGEVATMNIRGESDYLEEDVCHSFSYVTCGGNIVIPVKMCKVEIPDDGAYVCEPCIGNDRDLCPKLKRRTKFRRSVQFLDQPFEEKVTSPLFLRHRRQVTSTASESTHVDYVHINDKSDIELPAECPVPEFMFTADLECELTRTYLNCLSICDPMFTYPEGMTRNHTCIFSENQWKPRDFEECIDRDICRIKLHTRGKLTCEIGLSAGHNIKCHIYCESWNDKPMVPKEIYTCDMNGKWLPDLPHCVLKADDQDTTPSNDSTGVTDTEDSKLCDIQIFTRGKMSCESDESIEIHLRCRIYCTEWKGQQEVPPEIYICDKYGRWEPELPFCVNPPVHETTPEETAVETTAETTDSETTRTVEETTTVFRNESGIETTTVEETTTVFRNESASAEEVTTPLESTTIPDISGSPTGGASTEEVSTPVESTTVPETSGSPTGGASTEEVTTPVESTTMSEISGSPTGGETFRTFVFTPREIPTTGPKVIKVDHAGQVFTPYYLKHWASSLPMPRLVRC